MSEDCLIYPEGGYSISLLVDRLEDVPQNLKALSWVLLTTLVDDQRIDGGVSYAVVVGASLGVHRQEEGGVNVRPGGFAEPEGLAIERRRRLVISAVGRGFSIKLIPTFLSCA